MCLVFSTLILISFNCFFPSYFQVLSSLKSLFFFLKCIYTKHVSLVGFGNETQCVMSFILISVYCLSGVFLKFFLLKTSYYASPPVFQHVSLSLMKDLKIKLFCKSKYEDFLLKKHFDTMKMCV